MRGHRLSPALVRDIQRLAADGHNHTSIAAILHISPNTARWYAAGPVEPRSSQRAAPRPRAKPPAPTRRWDTTWHPRAACRPSAGGNPRDFDTYDRAHVPLVAALYCDDCPVLTQCHQWADADVGYEGIAAGRLWTPAIRNTPTEAA